MARLGWTFGVAVRITLQEVEPLFALVLPFSQLVAQLVGFTDLTSIPTSLLIMDANRALSLFASCRTRQIGAKLLGRVHRLCSLFLHTLQYAYGP